MPVDLIQDFQQLGLSGAGVQLEGPHPDSQLAAPGQDSPLVGQVVLPGAYPHHRQGGRDPSGGQGGGAGRSLFVQSGGRRAAFQQQCAHLSSLPDGGRL